MPIFRVSGRILYFAHVPKCAGSSIEDYLAERFGPPALLNRRHLPGNKHNWSKSSPQHISAEALQRMFPDAFFDAGFAFVRDPLSRARSAFHFHQSKRKKIPAETVFEDWMAQVPSFDMADHAKFDNHFLPQSTIVPDWCNIFKLEDGFEAFIEWLDQWSGQSHIRGVGRSLTGKYAIEPLSEELAERISRFYGVDYDRFSYDAPSAGQSGPANLHDQPHRHVTGTEPVGPGKPAPAPERAAASQRQASSGSKAVTGSHPGLPDPDQGWSRSVLRLEQAIVSPETVSVFAGGEHCAEAALYRNGAVYRGRLADIPEPVESVPGRHLWGGVLFYHFGHFVTESLSRLWAVKDSGATSIVFGPKGLGGKHPDKLVGWQQQLLGLLGVDLPVRIVYQPTRFEELLVPGPGFGLGGMAKSTPEFRSFVSAINCPDGPAGSGKLYLSRSGLQAKAGSILGQTYLEERLAQHGFEIFHPQQHSIEEQLRRMRAATHILGPDGSAFHLAGFVAQPHQTFTLIKRRSATDYLNICKQIEAMGAKVHVIDALTANWIRPGKMKSDDMSWGELDFGRLFERLAGIGLLDAAALVDDVAPSLESELIRLGQAHRGSLKRVVTG